MTYPRRLTIHSYVEFANHLRNCTQWDTVENDEPYDVMGITGLLLALLDNLQKNVHSSEIHDLSGMLSEDNLEFLNSLIALEQEY